MTVGLEFQFVGNRTDKIKEPGAVAVPRIGETVIFIENGKEKSYDVKHVYHIYEEDNISVQVVLRA